MIHWQKADKALPGERRVRRVTRKASTATAPYCTMRSLGCWNWERLQWWKHLHNTRSAGRNKTGKAEEGGFAGISNKLHPNRLEISKMEGFPSEDSDVHVSITEVIIVGQVLKAKNLSCLVTASLCQHNRACPKEVSICTGKAQC